jgi:anti-anti-sigma factor
MNITKTKNGTQLTISLEGMLDSIAAPELEDALKDELQGVEHIVFDMDKLTYICSSGLRILLSTSQKLKAEGGSIKLINVDTGVEDVLMLTGFKRVFAIETKTGHIYNPDLDK